MQNSVIICRFFNVNMGLQTDLWFMFVKYVAQGHFYKAQIDINMTVFPQIPFLYALSIVDIK